jgi:hypothetical protein
VRRARLTCRTSRPATDSKRIDFTALGEIDLKGAPGPIELFVARRQAGQAG